MERRKHRNTRSELLPIGPPDRVSSRCLSCSAEICNVFTKKWLCVSRNGWFLSLVIFKICRSRVLLSTSTNHALSADVKTADVKTADVKTADVKTADVKTLQTASLEVRYTHLDPHKKSLNPIGGQA